METLSLNWFDRQVVNFEASRFGAMAGMIGIQTCWGSIATVYLMAMKPFTIWQFAEQ